MAEKRNEKKLLVLLVVIVVLSLVVDLLSLNTLYNIAEARQSSREGELGAWWDWWLPWFPEEDSTPFYDYTSSKDFYYCSGNKVWHNVGGSTASEVEDCNMEDETCFEEDGDAWCE